MCGWAIPRSARRQLEAQAAGTGVGADLRTAGAGGLYGALEALARAGVGVIPLWAEEPLTLEHALDLTADSLNLYGARHDHWIVALSGGKDSITAVTAVR